jgi:hypothetical protein
MKRQRGSVPDDAPARALPVLLERTLMGLYQFRLMDHDEARAVLAAADKSAESYPERVKAGRLLSMQFASPREKAELAAYNEALEDAKWGSGGVVESSNAVNPSQFVNQPRSTNA